MCYAQHRESYTSLFLLMDYSTELVSWKAEDT